MTCPQQTPLGVHAGGQVGRISASSLQAYDLGIPVWVFPNFCLTAIFYLLSLPQAFLGFLSRCGGLSAQQTLTRTSLLDSVVAQTLLVLTAGVQLPGRSGSATSWSFRDPGCWSPSFNVFKGGSGQLVIMWWQALNRQ